MKKTLLLSFLFMTLGISNAQNPLKANAGEDQHFCFNYFMGDWLFVQLGGEPTASGGIPPYTYRWWSKQNGIFILGADTTAANPAVFTLGGFTAYVEVKDASESVALDSVVISTSEWPFKNTSGNFPKKYYISKGDSVWLEGHGLIIDESYKVCQWRSENGLLDIYVCDGFWVKPEVTTHYDLIVTDNYGCSEHSYRFCDTPLYKVCVDEIGIKDYDISSQVTIFPNPANETLFFSSKTEFVITDIQGRILLKSRDAVKNVDISHLECGLYFVKTGNQVTKLLKK